MGILSHALVQEAKLVTADLDVYGDQIPSDETVVSCRFRLITQIERGANTEGSAAADAILWFEPDVEIEEGGIIKADGSYWRIQKIVKARKIANDEVHFLKAYVQRHELSLAS